MLNYIMPLQSIWCSKDVLCGDSDATDVTDVTDVNFGEGVGWCVDWDDSGMHFDISSENM